MLVDAINHRRPSGATESTVFGPFHVEGAPIRTMGDDICLDGKGEACLFTGRVLDLSGAPVEDACVDVWSDNADGYYDVQQPGFNRNGTTVGGFSPGLMADTSFGGSSRRRIRSRTTVRSGRCSPSSAGTPTARRTCTS